LTIASRVPDHGKLMPWRFIVIEGDGRRRLGDLIARIFSLDNPEAGEVRLAASAERIRSAPVTVAVVSRAKPHPKIPEWEQVLSPGAAAMNLLPAAAALGYGAVWLTGWYAYDRRILEPLGLAPDEKIVAFIHLGTETERQTDRVRPALTDIVT